LIPLAGIEPPDSGRFLGVLSSKTGSAVQLVQGVSNLPEFSVPPKASVSYLFIVSAARPGLYEFGIELEFVSSDFVTSRILKEFTVSFLDAKTAQAIENKKYYAYGELVDLCGVSTNNSGGVMNSSQK
jgi:hypothetical protein